MSHLTLWLIRHGESTANQGIWTSKPFEAELTPLGREQAMKAAADIKQQPDLLIMSPLPRATQTAEFILKQWPSTAHQIWPIQELIYISPQHLQDLSPSERKEIIKAYWQDHDLYHSYGEDAEIFASFLKRVANFHQDIMKRQGFVVVVGHGQFFKAYQLALTHGFEPNKTWKALFREHETTHPMKNGEIIKLSL